MKDFVRESVRLFAYPLLVAWPLLYIAVTFHAAWFPHFHAPPVVNDGILFIGCILPVVIALSILEWKLPARADMQPTRVDRRTDAIHLLMGWIAYNPIGTQLVTFVAVLATARISAHGHPLLWPTHWPLLAQLALCVVVGEFGQYWFHRLAHETELLWRLHATHHGTHVVYWFNSTRFHALEAIVKCLFQVGPLVAAGVPHDAMLAYGFFTAVHGWTQHSNVAYRTRAFDWLMATSRNHRWHHSTILSEANNNYGTVVTIWDHLFRTYYSPNRAFDSAVGIGDMPNFPRTYLEQMMSPFVWRSLPRVQPTTSGVPVIESVETANQSSA